jgi:hypothetical protein
VTTNPTPRRLRIAGATAVFAVALAACGSSGSSGAASDSTAKAGATTTVAAAAAPKVTGAWARTSAASQTMGAAYMMIENPGTTEDALAGVSVAATVAAKAEMHETVADTGMGSATTAMGAATTAVMSDTTAMGSATTAAGAMGGAMKMQPVDKIAVPAKGSVELKPGGFHIMLIDLVKPLVKSDKFDLTLTFTSGAKTVVPVEVRDEA